MSRKWFIGPAISLAIAAGSACGQAPLAPSSTSAALSGSAATSAAGGRAATTGVVFVVSQGLYYDTFATKDPLPRRGKFQLLVNGTTEFGPGDREYLGGRWWEDLNGNGIQDDGDHFFQCPLLPPGRPNP